MPRKAARVTQADIARALRAVQQTGVTMAVEVRPDGTILLVPAERVTVSLNETKGKTPRRPVPL